MTDKKLTDNEIIKALECCAKAKTNEDCKKLKCPFFDDAIDMCGVLNSEQILIANALDLITRQQAEIENLKVENQSLRSAANSLKMHYEKAQAEVERLKPFEDKIAEFKSHIRVEDMLVFASSLEEWLEFCDNLKAEAYKECLAKVKNYIKTHCNPYGKPDFDYDTSIKILNFIDKLAKEMAGDDNA